MMQYIDTAFFSINKGKGAEMQPTTTSLAFSETGIGEPALLCLPGWCGGREVFAPLLDHAGGTRRAVSVDWRGHGDSPAATEDFGSADLVQDAIDLITSLELDRVVPLGLSHAGWVAFELRRQLGPDRVPAVVLLDWMPIGPPSGFADALLGLQDPQAWSTVRDQLFALWTDGVDDGVVHQYVQSMGAYGYEMWSRAGREIARSFAATPVPLAAFAELARQGTPCPTLHLYAQPRDDVYVAQQAYAAAHPWFEVRRLEASSHFPCLEIPDEIAAEVDEFLAGVQ
jgi:pimeloyl-ACP methyl ester carboxylesterase